MIQNWSITLQVLTQGNSILSKHTEFRIRKSIAHAIIPEICQAIWKVLQPIFLSSMDQNSWKNAANGFFNN